MKVLIAEDTEDSRIMLEMLLGAQGYDVMSSSNGIEALQLARSSRPDLIISDIMMPEMDGFELCRQLKADPELMKIPFIFYTATYTEHQDEELAMALGAACFIIKPLAPQALMVIIDEVMTAFQTGDLALAQDTSKDKFELEEMHLHSLGRKLDKKVRELEQEREALQHSEEKYRHLVESVQNHYFFFTHDTAGVFTYISPSIEHILGYKQEEFLVHYSRYLTDNPLNKQVEQYTEQILKGQEQPPYELEIAAKDGSLHWLEIKKSAAFDDQGNVSHLEGIAQDISKRKLAEKMTREQAKLLDLIFKYSLDSIVLLDKDYNYLRVSETYAKACQKNILEFTGHNYFDYYPSNLKDKFDEARKNKSIYQETARPFEFPDHPERKTTYWDLALVPILDKEGEIVLFLFTLNDVTNSQRASKLIEYHATFDALTDLPNRFLALDRLSQLIKEAHRDAKRVAVLFLDLDDFKKINDTLGHDIGDKLLIEAAERLRSGMRSGDTVGRLGGDEFIILLSGLVNATDARPIAENMINRFRDAFIIENRELILTSSIGIAVYPDDADSPTELLRKADSAMYHSKELGRNTYSYFTDAMNQEVSRRLVLEEQMHGALNRGEFHVLYQPQVEVSSGHISGVEALLRWHNPLLGNVSPEEFIPIAEHTGLIIPIGQFVLTEALTMAAKWQNKREKSFVMAVNLSPNQFRDPKLMTFIEQALIQYGVSGNNLDLEITEGVLMSGYAYIDDALSQLSELGVGIAMDDFGTGYSSLSYLRSYPFTILKIDRSFINDITVNPADRELVNAAISMSHSLGLKVVAEGVETQEQLEHLVSQGCDFAQGYLFSKPVTAETITKLIEAE